MGWLFSLIIFIYACITRDTTAFIGAGIFAIAGTMSVNGTLARADKKSKKDSEE